MSARWQRWADVALSALPVLVMGALAAWSFWLVRTTPGAAPPGATRPVSALPDMHLTQFVAETFDAQGQRSSRVRGTEAWHHPSDDSMEVAQARVWAQRKRDGQVRETTAHGARLWVNGAQTQYRLTGEAEVHQTSTAPGVLPIRVQGDELFLDDAAQQVSSAQPVVLTQGSRRLSGDRMHYDQGTGRLDLTGQVRWSDAGQH